MISEKEYVIENFKKNFDKHKNKRMVIYGVGQNTKLILDNFREYNIIGLMDQEKTGEIVFGKKVLSFEEVVKEKIEIIIIVARYSNIKIILRRIDKFAEKNEIDIFDINGENLLKNSENEELYDKYFEVKEEDLKKEILKHEIVSFDIFDTLVTRKALYPIDIFEIVSTKMKKQLNLDFDFKNIRINAERKLNSLENPNIYEIYDEIQDVTKISDDMKEKLMRLEIETEKDNLIQRSKMVDILKWSVKENKKVYLISDMYLNEEIIRDILSNLDITGYNDIFVSCKYRKSKCGGLYKEYLNKIGERSCIHIGDDYESDYIAPKHCGIDTFHIRSPRDMCEISICREVYKYVDSLENRQAIGLLVSKVFNNPFILNECDGKIVFNSYKDIGYIFVAPVINKFISWLTEKVKSEKNTLILFAARDGFIIKNMYDKLKELEMGDGLPDSVYFLTSRAVATIAGIKNDNDLRYISEIAFSGTPEMMLKKRFLLNDEEINKYDKDKTLEEFVFEHKDKIYRRSKECRDNYLKYIEQFNLEEYEKIVFFDFVSSGTCQLFLEKILNRKLSGLYFARMKNDYKEKQELNIQSLFRGGFIYEQQNFICDNYILLENIITSYMPTLCAMDKNGEPIYLKESRKESEIDGIREIHLGIEEYFKDYYSNIKCLDNNNISVEMVDLIFSYIQEEYSKGKLNLFKEQVLVDEYCNREFKFV